MICLALIVQFVSIFGQGAQAIVKTIFIFIFSLPWKISSLMAELKAMKQEKGDTEEARKMAEEHIEKMKKDHEEKVLIFLLLFVVIVGVVY